MLRLAAFPEAVTQATEADEPSLVSDFLLETASQFNHFYNQVRVLGSPAGVQEARLALVSAVCTVLASGLKLLGVPLLERM